MGESRFERWSRLKAEARQEAEAPDPEVLEQAQEIANAEEVLAENEKLSDAEILAKYELPDPDKSELGMDIKGFLNQEIPEALRRRALRSLWRSNPVLAVLDGLNDYDEDYTISATPAGGIKTLYKVGQGMFERVRKLDEQLESALQSHEEIQPSEPVVPIQSVVPPAPKLEQMAGTFEALNADAPEAESVEASSEEVPQRYRPRMKFDF